MERVESFEQYRQMVSAAKRIPGVVSNCYLLPGAVREKIEKRTIFAKTGPAGLLLLEKEDGFFRCHAYLAPDMPADRLSLPEPVVSELVFEREQTTAQRTLAAGLTRQGFVLGRESARMRLNAPDVPDEPAPRVEPAGLEDLDLVREMILNTFEPLYSFIRTRDEMWQDIQKGAMFVIREAGTVVAVLYAEEEKGTASIRQVTVSPAFREKGYGRQLVAAYHRAYRDRVRAFSHWVDLANGPAIRLYEHFGYSFDGRRANEYIIR